MNKEKLIELKKAMSAETQVNGEIATKRVKFESDNEGLFVRQKRIREQIAEQKLSLAVEAESEFKEDGIKKRLGGIGIRVLKILKYDADVALAWAKKKDLFLQLDTKSFDNVAKTGEIDFVKVEDNITVTFPKKLVIENE